MRRARRNAAMWVIAAAVLAVGVAVVWSVVGARRRASGLFDRGPGVPTPSAADAAAVPLTGTGTRLTVKQRSHAWLPGGRFKLHLDDITGSQVLVSVTDIDGRVVLGPESVRAGESFTVADMDIDVKRLENVLVGSADFGEFVVKPAAPTTAPGNTGP